MARVIDISRDYVFQTDVTELDQDTGDSTAATGITGWTAHISATRGGSTIHADLSKDLAERSETSGRYFAAFDQLDLTANLETYVGRFVWIVISKYGDVGTKSFRRLVAAHIDGDDT